MIMRNYYAVIPADVRYSDIPQGAKLLYGEITALCNDKGYCWASTVYFAHLYEKNKSTILRWLKCLEDEGFIRRQCQFIEGSKEVECRRIYLSDPSRKNETGGGRKNERGGGRKNETDNNTYINNTYINNILSSSLDYLNEKTGSHYRTSTKKTKQHIKARVDEGYTLDDFKKVIDTKVADWGNDPKMCQYLRPDTLFGTKFESYLNQKVIEKPGIEINEKQREGMRDVVDWNV